MPKLVASMLVLCVIVPRTAALEDCGNGAYCFQKCVSKKPAAGWRYACTTTSGAGEEEVVVCGDARFSCPSGTICDDFNSRCKSMTSANSSTSMLQNSDAHRAAKDVATEDSSTFCGLVKPELPSECECLDRRHGGVVNCSITLAGSDTFGLFLDVLPCDAAAHMDIRVTESLHHINYTVADISAGTSKEYPLPGMSVSIPTVGEAGLLVDVAFMGSLADLALKVGINACAESGGQKLCGSDLSSHLPFWIVNHTFHFGHFCDSSRSSQPLLIV